MALAVDKGNLKSDNDVITRIIFRKIIHLSTFDLGNFILSVKFYNTDFQRKINILLN